MPSKALVKRESDFTPEQAAQVVIKGDLSTLPLEAKAKYMVALCGLVGLHPASRPFEYVSLNGKLVLYATKSCTDQIRVKKKVSCKVVRRERVGDVYLVEVEATLPDGRVDFATGAVPLDKKWDKDRKEWVDATATDIANAIMKAETKAKRRATLSIAGLGFALDESELETTNATPVSTKLTEETKKKLLEVTADKAALLDENLKSLGVSTVDELTEENAGTIIALLEE